MPRVFQDVTEAELAVLQVLWEKETATRREIADVLYPGGGPAHYTTVQKLLQRLENKGHVRKKLAGGVQTFRAALSREKLVSQRLLAVADKLCDGSITPLMMNLIQTQKLTKTELAELRELIERFQEER